MVGPLHNDDDMLLSMDIPAMDWSEFHSPLPGGGTPASGETVKGRAVFDRCLAMAP